MNDHEKKMYCLRCGRKLKDLQSMELGFGPTCYRKHLLGKTKYRKPLFSVKLREDSV